MSANRERDPNLDHEAVKAYRDQFKFCPNAHTRKEIVMTVTDLELWQDVLTNWGYWKEGKWIKFNPLSVRKMMSEYERRAGAKHSERSNGANRTVNQSSSNEKDLQVGLPERRDSSLRVVSEAERGKPRRSYNNLDDLLAQVMRPVQKTGGFEK